MITTCNPQHTVFSVNMIRQAAQQIKGICVRTPLLESPLLNEHFDARIFLKCENLQHTGSFKFRGAYYRLSQLSRMEKQGGVLAFSSGNHAQGVAYAAKLLGIQSTIIMPDDAPKLKVEGTRYYGADIVFYDRYKEDREAVASEWAKGKTVTIIPPYNDRYIIAGQGTVGLEIVEDLHKQDIQPDIALTNCGGGGLSAGMFTVLYDSYPDLQGYTVEPEGYDDVKQSLAVGRIQSVDFSSRSICDALLTPSPGSLTFPVLQNLGVSGLSVTDETVRQTIGFLAKRLKLVGEPGGVASVAALLSNQIDISGKTVICVISGGNIENHLLVECLDIILNK